MENMCISGEVTCHMENMLKPLMLLIDGMWLTFSPPLLLYVKLHIIHKRISNWRMGGDFMHTMWCMTNPKRAKVTIACTALITPYREPTDTGYDMSPGKCGTYKIWYDITDMIWYRQDMILQTCYDITGMIWYNTDKTWYVRGSLIGVLCYIPYWPEGRLFDLIIHMHLTLWKLCLKSQVWLLRVPTYVRTR